MGTVQKPETRSVGAAALLALALAAGCASAGDDSTNTTVSRTGTSTTTTPGTPGAAATAPTTSAEREVGDVIGFEVDAAIETLEALGFEVATETGVDVVAGFNAGQVTEQDPAGGVSAVPGITVRLAVAPVTVMIPNVVGMTESAARVALDAAGLRLSTRVVEVDAVGGTVVAVAPPPGDTVAEDSWVRLEIADPDIHVVTVEVTVVNEDASAVTEEACDNYGEGNGFIEGDTIELLGPDGFALSATIGHAADSVCSWRFVFPDVREAATYTLRTKNTGLKWPAVPLSSVRDAGWFVGLTSKLSSLPLVVGTFTLFDEVVGPWDACRGAGGYSDFGPGMSVTAKGADGTLVGAGATRLLGTADLDGTNPGWEAVARAVEAKSGVTCTVVFDLALSATSDVYSIEVGRRGAQSFSHDDLAAANWNVELTLGL